MDFKKICPSDIIKLSSSISLILIDRFDTEELSIIKNILCDITNNISSYLSQCYIYEKYKNK